MGEERSLGPTKHPKVFISYSWKNQEHQEMVLEWAKRLVFDGVKVILDLWDFKEGQDQYAFMESMVTDPTVTHVLVICEKTYRDKANSRTAGVGTESLIISGEVYKRADQTKFIPVVCEFDDKLNAVLPEFLKSRKWIDFSSPEKVNENWEQLVRVLYGKPRHRKPELGMAPAYLSEDEDTIPSPVHAKYSNFRAAVMQGKKAIGIYRTDFLNACIEHADSFRVRVPPDAEDRGQKIVADCGELTHVRDYLIDWLFLETEIDESGKLSEVLVATLERLLALRLKPAKFRTWEEDWFEPLKLFVYEVFLYVVAALMVAHRYDVLRGVFVSRYYRPNDGRWSEDVFQTFETFYFESEALPDFYNKRGQKHLNATAEFIKSRAQRRDISFENILEADLLAFLMALVTPDVWWYPQTLVYRSGACILPFFLRATQHRHFERLSAITGITDAEALRKAAMNGAERLRPSGRYDFHHMGNLWEAMNMEKLDSIS